MFQEEFPVPEDWAKRAWVDDARYQEMYDQSIKDPDAFWGDQGKRIDWITPYTRVKNVSYDASNLHVKWYEDGVLNASVNCLARHLAKRGAQTGHR